MAPESVKGYPITVAVAVELAALNTNSAILIAIKVHLVLL